MRDVTLYFYEDDIGSPINVPSYPVWVGRAPYSAPYEDSNTAFILNGHASEWLDRINLTEPRMYSIPARLVEDGEIA